MDYKTKNQEQQTKFPYKKKKRKKKQQTKRTYYLRKRIMEVNAYIICGKKEKVGLGTRQH